MKVNGGYDWIRKCANQSDGCTPNSYSNYLLPKIMQNNRYNQTPKGYSCPTCGSVDRLTGSYISLIDEDEFLATPKRFIENAYKKSQILQNYDIYKDRKLDV